MQVNFITILLLILLLIIIYHYFIYTNTENFINQVNTENLVNDKKLTFLKCINYTITKVDCDIIEITNEYVLK